MPDLENLARELEDSIGGLIEAAGGRPGFFRRFVPRADVEVSAENNGHGEREESPAG
jgi:hypothetical protein